MPTVNVDSLGVYRLLPSKTGGRLMKFSGAVVSLMRWQVQGSAGDPPADVTANWLGGPDEPRSAFPSGFIGVPVLSRRIMEPLGAELLTAGRLLPLPIDGSDADGYCLYIVERVVDCLDTARSSEPKPPTGEIAQSVFDTDKLPTSLPAFRLPQFPTAVYWNGWAVHRIVELLGTDIEARLVWSDDPALTPHPNPWGFG